MFKAFNKFSLIILIFLSLDVIGQDAVVFEKKQPCSHKVVFVAEPTGWQITNNYFIAEIAHFLQQKMEFTGYQIDYDQILRITQNQLNNYSVFVSLQSFKCQGEFKYRQFSLCDLLIPEFCSADISIFNGYRQLVKQKSLDKLTLQPGINVLFADDFTDTARQQNFSIEISDLDFDFSAGAVNRFNDRLKLIDEYYQVETQFEQIRKQITAIDFTNIDMLLVYDLKLAESEKKFDFIYLTDYPGKLKLSEFDPMSVIHKLNSLSDSLINIRQQLNEKLVSLDKIYYQRGLAEKLSDIAKAKYYFNRSVVFNQNNAASHYELAKILFHQDSITEAGDKLLLILGKLNPESLLLENTLDMADSVYNKLLEKGFSYVQFEKYNEAIEVFNYCYAFCGSIKKFYCSGLHIKGMSQARFGIYRSYLAVAQKALESSKPELAEVYINEAIDYQKKNQEHIISSAEALQKMETLLNVYINRCSDYNNLEQFDKAGDGLLKISGLVEMHHLSLPVGYYEIRKQTANGIFLSLVQRTRKLLNDGKTNEAETALAIALQYRDENKDLINSTIITDTLLNRLKFRQYNSLIAGSIKQLELNYPEEALELLLAAKSLENTFDFKKDERLDSLLPAVSKPIIIRRLNIIRERMVANWTDSLATEPGKILKMSDQCLLTDDKEINKFARNLDSMMYHKKCSHYRQVFDSLFSAALILQIQHEYIPADSMLALALNIATTRNDCNIETADVASNRKMYFKNTEYQKLIKRSELYLHNKSYSEYFFYYSEAEKYYYNNQLKFSGMQHFNFMDLVNISSDTAFVLASYNYLVDKKQYDLALSCLKALKQMNYEVEKSKKIQQQLAVKMALRDHIINYRYNPKLMILNYTADDLWFEYFARAYLKTWRSVR